MLVDAKMLAHSKGHQTAIHAVVALMSGLDPPLWSKDIDIRAEHAFVMIDNRRDTANCSSTWNISSANFQSNKKESRG